MTPMSGFESKPSAEIKRRLSNPNNDKLIQLSPVTVSLRRRIAPNIELIIAPPVADVRWRCVLRPPRE